MEQIDSSARGKELTSPFSLLHMISHKQIWEVISQHIVCNMLLAIGKGNSLRILLKAVSMTYSLYILLR